MRPSIEELKEQLSKNLDQIKAIGDEIRSKVQDASKDAKALWEQLEPRLTEVERHFKEAGVAARLAIDEIVKAMQAFAPVQEGAEKAASGQPEQAKKEEQRQSAVVQGGPEAGAEQAGER